MARPVVRVNATDTAPMRSVWVSAFDEEAAQSFTRDIAAIRQARQPVLPLVIVSAGGEVYSLLAMLDALATYDGTVLTVALGQAMSCGAVLFSCGAQGHRYIAPNATLLLHDVSGPPVGGKAEEQQVNASESTRLNDLLWRRLSTNIGKPPGYLRSLHGKRNGVDWYLSAREAVRVGLASRVGLPVVEVRQRLDPLLSTGGER